jgi:hypothetical protein
MSADLSRLPVQRRRGMWHEQAHAVHSIGTGADGTGARLARNAAAVSGGIVEQGAEVVICAAADAGDARDGGEVTKDLADRGVY